MLHDLVQRQAVSCQAFALLQEANREGDALLVSKMLSGVVCVFLFTIIHNALCFVSAPTQILMPENLSQAVLFVEW